MSGLLSTCHPSDWQPLTGQCETPVAACAVILYCMPTLRLSCTWEDDGMISILKKSAIAGAQDFRGRDPSTEPLLRHNDLLPMAA